MYPYAVVEKALAGFFEIEAERLAAFRGRMRHLQKLGLAPEAPGSGKRVRYSVHDICDLALAMSLAEFGADPKEIVKEIPSGTFKKHYRTLRDMDRPQCVYVPYYFSGRLSELLFCKHKDAFEIISKRPTSRHCRY